MRSKILIAAMVIAALALIATACAPAPAPAAPTSAPAPAGPTAPPAASGKFTCADKLGCVDIGPTDPVHIAYAFVTSGDN